MPADTPRRLSLQNQGLLTSAVVAVIVVGALYWARVVIIPLAMAVFVAFILGPSVTRLTRLGIGRLPAVLSVVALALLMVGTIGWLVGAQITSLVQELPDHTDRIAAKLSMVQEWTSDNKLGSLLKEIEKVLHPVPVAGPSGSVTEPVTVVVTGQRPAWVAGLGGILGPLAEAGGQFLLTVLLAVFILFNKQDARNRMLRLIGSRRLTTSTKAMDDAGNRISRYLRVQLLVNASFGLALAIGLMAIQVRYALLWGFVAAIMRYIPYVGTWFALIPPLIASIAMSDSLWSPIGVLAVFVALELIVNGVIEPRLFGHSLGLSDVATVFSAAFWGFLWGPIGLVLSGPMTACCLVLGKNVPQLHWLEVLLGADEALPPAVTFYQRLAARDRDEAGQIAETFAAKQSRDHAFDALLIPALGRAKQAIANQELTGDDEEFIVGAIREIADELDESTTPEVEEPLESKAARVPILTVPSGGAGDALALDLLTARLDPRKWDVRKLEHDALASQVLAAVHEHEPAVVVIGSLAPEGIAHTKYLCKRLRARYPELKLLLGRWSPDAVSPQAREELIASGADEVSAHITAGLQYLESWRAPLAADGPQVAPAPVNRLDERVAAAAT